MLEVKIAIIMIMPSSRSNLTYSILGAFPVKLFRTPSVGQAPTPQSQRHFLQNHHPQQGLHPVVRGPHQLHHVCQQVTGKEYSYTYINRASISKTSRLKMLRHTGKLQIQTIKQYRYTCYGYISYKHSNLMHKKSVNQSNQIKSKQISKNKTKSIQINSIPFQSIQP